MAGWIEIFNLVRERGERIKENTMTMYMNAVTQCMNPIGTGISLNNKVI